MRRFTAVVFISCWPDTAWAHGSMPGMVGFYRGLSHPFTLPAQLLMLLALGLAVQQRLPNGENLLKAFAGASVIGLAAAVAVPGLNPEPLLLLMAISCGLLVASSISVGRSMLWIAGALAGLP